MVETCQTYQTSPWAEKRSFVEIKKKYKQLNSATEEELAIKVTTTTSSKLFAEVFYAEVYYEVF